MSENLAATRHELRVGPRDTWSACTKNQYEARELAGYPHPLLEFRALYPEDQVRQLCEQRAALLEALQLCVGSLPRTGDFVEHEVFRRAQKAIALAQGDAA